LGGAAAVGVVDAGGVFGGFAFPTCAVWVSFFDVAAGAALAAGVGAALAGAGVTFGVISGAGVGAATPPARLSSGWDGEAEAVGSAVTSPRLM
jgi:hypothetical protein